MHFMEPNLQMVAGESIPPSRIVKVSAAADNTVLLNVATTTFGIGISQKGSRRAPGTGDDDGNAAIAGENIGIYAIGSGVAPIQLSGTSTSGDYITSDGSTGKGATSVTDANCIVGILLQSGIADQIVAILVNPFTLAHA